MTLIGVPVTGETVADVDDNLRTNSGKSFLAILIHLQMMENLFIMILMRQLN